MATAVDSGAQGVRWDLTPLAPSEDAMKERLEAAVADAHAFVERWPADLIEAIEPDDLATLLGELADLHASYREGRYWTMLVTWTDSENPAVQDVQAWVSLLALVALVAEILLQAFILPGLSRPPNLSAWECILTGVVACYFGTRC